MGASKPSVSLFGLFLLVACAGREDLRPAYEDLLADPARWPSPGPQSLECSDESHWGVELADGATLEFKVNLGDAPRLRLSGCRSGGGEQGIGTLRLAMGEGDEAVEVDFPLVRQERWWDSTVPLGGLARQTSSGRLSVALEGGSPLILRDVFFEHERRGPGVAGHAQTLILISIDTLRADALGSYGGSFHTPHLDRLAAEAQVYLQHYATATWTKPSHASLLTGHPPAVGASLDRPIDPRVPTLAERLKAAGFATHGQVHDCLWLDPDYGFGRGFDRYESRPWQPGEQVRRLVNWIGDHRDRPSFAFLHTFEVHSDFRHLPYESPGTTRFRVARRFGLETYGCLDGVCASERLARINAGKVTPLPQEAEILKYLYGRSVEEVDRELGVFFEDLRAMGVYDKALIVVTSDHGEGLLEHGKTLHVYPWQEVLRVPLLVKWPRGANAGERIDRPTSALDVVPTLLAHLGLDATGLPGEPLLGRPADRPVFAGTTHPTVILGNLKAIFDPRTGKAELFDLEADPGELEDLSALRTTDLDHLARLLAENERAYRRSQAPGSPSPDAVRPLDPEDERRLRSLGYVDGG